MRINRIVLFYFSTIVISLFLIACEKKGKDSKTPVNEITESSTIQTTIAWSVMDSSNATENADLDIYFIKGAVSNQNQMKGNIIKASDEKHKFDVLTIPVPKLQDGEYTLAVEFLDIMKPGNYEIEIQGITAGKKHTVTGFSFKLSDDSAVKFPVTISKTGDKFSIIKN